MCFSFSRKLENHPTLFDLLEYIDMAHSGKEAESSEWGMDRVSELLEVGWNLLRFLPGP